MMKLRRYSHPCREREAKNTDIVIVNKIVAELVVSELKRRYGSNFIIKEETPELFVTIVCTEKLYPSVQNQCVEFALGLLRGLSLRKDSTK